MRGQTKTRRQNMLVCIVNASVNWQPVQLPQNRRDMVASSGSSEKPSSGVLGGLNSSDKIVVVGHHRAVSCSNPGDWI